MSLKYTLVLLWVCTWTVGACSSGQANQKEKSQDPEPAARTEVACRAHSDCPSGACNHYKKDNGFCAPEVCQAGERTDNNNIYCTAGGLWAKSKRAGDPCKESWECYQPTCFMNPNCDAMPKQKGICKEGSCALESIPDACTAAGNKKVLAAEEYMATQDGTCVQSMAQRVLRTVCVPCGNGQCDQGESACNCPADCPGKAATQNTGK